MDGKGSGGGVQGGGGRRSGGKEEEEDDAGEAKAEDEADEAAESVEGEPEEGRRRLDCGVGGGGVQLGGGCRSEAVAPAIRVVL